MIKTIDSRIGKLDERHCHLSVIRKQDSMEGSVDKHKNDEEEKSGVHSSQKFLFQLKKISSFCRPLCMKGAPTEESLTSLFPLESTSECKQIRNISRVLLSILSIVLFI